MWYRKKYWYRLFCKILTHTFRILISVFFLFILVMPKPTVSEIEKRELAKMPAFSFTALWNRSFAQDFEAFLNDTFPFREQFVSMAAMVDNWKGIRPDGIKIVDTSTPQQTTSASSSSQQTTVASSSNTTKVSTSSTTTSATTTSATTATTAEPDPEFPVEKRGAVLLYHDIAFEIFGGNQAQTERYADAVSAYAEQMPDVKVYNLVVPSSAAFNLPQKYANYSGDQRSNISHLYESLSPKVTAIDVFDILQEHKDEYIYFGTDHHWTGLGAYYAYTEFAKVAGFEPLDYDDYEKGTLTGFKGTLYAATNDPNLKEDTVEYCKIPVETEAYLYQKDAQDTPLLTTVLAEYAKGVNSYSVYFHGDFPRFDVKNLDNPNGRNIMVIKESYGNAFAPYLIPHYENMYVIDLRYFSGSIQQLVKEKEIDEILIIDNIFAANTKHYTDRLELMLSR